MQYLLGHSHDKTILFKTDDGEGSLQTARKLLAETIEMRSQAIESKFGISLARAGEDVIKQRTIDDACNVHDAAMIKTRTATLPELIGLEAALEHSQPSQKGGDGKGPIKIYFLQKPMYESGDTAAHYVQSDSKNNRAIYIDPDMLQGVPVMARDASNRSGDRYYSIEAIFTHELGHNSEFNMGWQKAEVQAHLAEAIGWKKYVDPVTKKYGWLIEGKADSYYKHDIDDCHGTAAWIYSDARGDRLNAKGQAVKSVAQAEHVKAVKKVAKYPPATDYFDNPTEEVAEGLMMYRLSGEDRQQLFKKKAQLYYAVKEHDQAEIDATFGRDKDNLSRLIRGIDGMLVANTEDNRRPIKKLEGK